DAEKGVEAFSHGARDHGDKVDEGEKKIREKPAKDDRIGARAAVEGIVARRQVGAVVAAVAGDDVRGVVVVEGVGAVAAFRVFYRRAEGDADVARRADGAELPRFEVERHGAVDSRSVQRIVSAG